MKTNISFLEPNVEVTTQDILNVDLSSPHGPKGDKGDKGDRGLTGPQGPKGDPGEDAVVDPTLTKSGQAADAKVTGDKLEGLKEDLNGLIPIPITYEYGFTDGSRINASDGTTGNHANSSRTDYINVNGHSTIYYTCRATTSSSGSSVGMAFYNSEKEYISGQILLFGETEPTAKMRIVNVPNNAVYARFTYFNFTDPLFSSIPFVVYDYDDYFTSIKTSYGNSVQKIDQLFTEHENLWNLTTIIEGKGVNNSGAITVAANYSVTDYIPIYGNDVLYCRDTARYAFYDSDKNFISSATTSSCPLLYDDIHVISVPENAYYFIICAVTENTRKLIYTSSVIEKYLKQLVEENSYQTYFTGKKLGVVGHSGPQGMRLTNMLNAWPYVTKTNLHMSGIQNYAVGGATIAKREDSYEDIFFSLEDFQSASKDVAKRYLVKDAPTNAHPYMLYKYTDSWIPAYSSRTALAGARSPVVDIVRSLDTDVDAIIIGAGANDYHYAWTPFGTFEDRTKYTFYGALHVLLGYLMATYKGIPIFFTDAIIPTTIGNRGTDVNEVGKTYSDYRNAIIEVCKYYRVPWIDIDEYTNFPTAETDSSWYADDLLHMSLKGHQRIGEFVAGKIKNYLIV